MYRIDTGDAAASLPTPSGLGAEGFFSRGNPATGQAATTLDQDFFNALQENLVAIVAAAGLARSKSDYGRLWQALLRCQTFQDSGSANHLVAGPPAGVNFAGASLGFGLTVRVKIAVTNTGPVGFAWAGTPELGVTYPDGSAIQAGDFPSGALVELVHNGAGFWHCLAMTPPAIRNLFSESFTGPTPPGSGSGWCKLPNGLLMQWEAGLFNNQTLVTRNFPLAFPNAAFFSIAQLGYGLGSLSTTAWAVQVGAQPISATQYTLAIAAATPGTDGVWLLHFGY